MIELSTTVSHLQHHLQKQKLALNAIPPPTAGVPLAPSPPFVAPASFRRTPAGAAGAVAAGAAGTFAKQVSVETLKLRDVLQGQRQVRGQNALNVGVPEEFHVLGFPSLLNGATTQEFKKNRINKKKTATGYSSSII